VQTARTLHTAAGLPAAVLLLALLVPTGPAGADDELAGTTGLLAKSTLGRSVFLGDAAYRVTDATALRDANGEALAFADLPVPDIAPDDEPPPLARLMARFEAERRGDDLELLSLEVLSGRD